MWFIFERWKYLLKKKRVLLFDRGAVSFSKVSSLLPPNNLQTCLSDLFHKFSLFWFQTLFHRQIYPCDHIVSAFAADFLLYFSFLRPDASLYCSYVIQGFIPFAYFVSANLNQIASVRNPHLLSAFFIVPFNAVIPLIMFFKAKKQLPL